MTQLYAHQSDAIERAKKQNLALFHSCGTGKTLTMLKLIEYYKSTGIGPALVVCPKSIIEPAWINDATQFTPDLKIVSLRGKSIADRRIQLAKTADIYVVNFDLFRIDYERIIYRKFDILIVDESSKMKDQKTQITRALLSLAGIGFWKSKYKTNIVIPCRYVLSGTPSPNNEMGYWSQVKMVTGKGNQGFCDNFYSFRGQYFNLIDVGNNQKIPKFRKYMADQFNAAMKPFCSVARKEDVLDLPPQTFEIRKIELSPDERRAYDTFKKDLVLRYKDLTIVGSTILTEIMKLRQLTSSFAYTDTGIMQTGKSKLNELDDLLEEIGDSQVLIWANFREEIRVIKELLGEQCAILSGVASDDEKKDAIEGFQQGRYKYLVANPQSGAHGLSFVNCRYMIYFSLNYSYELDKQSAERIHRIGQHHNSTYYYLIAEKTIDETIYKVLQRKAELSTSILNFLKNKD